MSCYFRHLKDIFEEAGIVVTPENKKALDRKMHEAAGVEYKDCPAAWRGIKEILTLEGGSDKLIEALKK